MNELAIHGGHPVRTRPWVSKYLGSEEIGQAEQERLLDVLRKKRVFRYIPGGIEDSEAAKLEQEYAAFTNTHFALAVNSGTSALISALVGVGVGPGDEVIIPAFAWIATASAVVALSAIPVICNIDDSLTINPAVLEQVVTPYTKAILAVHMRGMSCDMSAIINVANRHGIKVVEDVAQANGGMSEGRMLGSIGDVGCFSLQQSKVITTGEGGMVVTDDENIWQRATMFHDCAMYPFRFTEMKIPSFAGQNYRLTELQAALCLGQIGRMPSILSRTTKTKERLVQRLKNVTQIRFSDSFGTERDLGISLVFYVQDAKTALYFSEALTCEGVPAQPLFDQSQKDLHVVVNWEFLMKRQDAWGGHYPWDQEFYKGSVQYAPELWQDSLDILSSAVQIRLNQLIEDEDCDDICAAVEKVAHYLEQVGGLNG